MTTRGIIDRVIPWCPGWERSSGRKSLLKVLQQGVDELFSWDHDCMIFRGTDNKGFQPYLLTTAGTYDYSITATNLSCDSIVRSIGGTDYTFIARKLHKIFCDASTIDFDEVPWIGNPYYLNQGPYSFPDDRSRFVDIKVSSQAGYESTAPTVKFQFDPTTTTERFFCSFFIGPPRLTSEQIPIPIPVEFEKDLENYIIGFVQWRENGKSNEYMSYFENVTKPRFQTVLNSMPTPNESRIVPNYT